MVFVSKCFSFAADDLSNLSHLPDVNKGAQSFDEDSWLKSAPLQGQLKLFCPASHLTRQKAL